MAIILNKDILTKEPIVKIITEKGNVVFNGTENDLIIFIRDSYAMAESIRMDLEAENIDASNEGIAIEQYQEFSKKY
jgi:hypothetical protein